MLETLWKNAEMFIYLFIYLFIHVFIKGEVWAGRPLLHLTSYVLFDDRLDILDPSSGVTRDRGQGVQNQKNQGCLQAYAIATMNFQIWDFL